MASDSELQELIYVFNSISYCNKINKTAAAKNRYSIFSWWITFTIDVSRCFTVILSRALPPYTKSGFVPVARARGHILPTPTVGAFDTPMSKDQGAIYSCLTCEQFSMRVWMKAEETYWDVLPIQLLFPADA